MKLALGFIVVALVLSFSITGAVYVMGEIVLFVSRVMMDLGNLIW